MIKPEGTALNEKDFTAGTNNFLHCLCSISLNDTKITQATELYNYRAYLDTLLTYVTDAAASHLTNAYWYVDSGDLPCDTSAAADATTMKNTGFIGRNRMKQIKVIQLYGTIHADICNVPLYLLFSFAYRSNLRKSGRVSS